MRKKLTILLVVVAVVCLVGALWYPVSYWLQLRQNEDENAALRALRDSGAAATATPTPEPTPEPTAAPTTAPTAELTAAPTAAQTEAPTPEPTAEPTAAPTAEPTAAPTAAPTAEPTAAPPAAPTGSPAPTATATPASTATAATAPTEAPSPVAETAPAETAPVTEIALADAEVAEEVIVTVAEIAPVAALTEVEPEPPADPAWTVDVVEEEPALTAAAEPVSTTRETVQPPARTVTPETELAPTAEPPETLETEAPWEEETELQEMEMSLPQVEIRRTGRAGESKELTEEPLQREILPKYRALYEKNSDMIGWLTIPDTGIDYPVMQTPQENTYYLHRGFDRKENNNGCLILEALADIQTPSPNLIIYGHNMRSGAMFAHLSRFAYKDFWPTHKTLRFDSLWEEREYVVIACLRTVLTDNRQDGFGYFVDFSDEEDFEKWLGFIRNMRYYDPGVAFDVTDNYLTFSTCSYHEEDGRLLVICRQLREGETANKLEMAGR